MSENTTPDNETPLTPDFRKRIERGAAWLDRVKPGWRDLIDLDTLNLADAESCVLGQVFADEADDLTTDGFDYVAEYMSPPPEIETNWFSKHGFDQSINLTAASPWSLDYTPLTDAWREYLTD